MFGGLGVGVAAIYYIITLRTNQKTLKTTLETRQAQLYMYFAQQMTSDTWAEHMIKIDQSKWSSLEEFNQWYSDDPRNQVCWGIVLNYFENAGVLVHKDLLDIDIVATAFAGMTRRFWEKMKPIVLSQRVTWNQPRLASEFEYLYNRLMRYMEEHSEFKT